jgi:hypothetical protein
MKAYVVVDVWIHYFLTSSLVGGEVSFMSRSLFLRRKSPWCTLDMGWVGLRAGLDAVEKKNSWPYRDSNFNPSVFQPVASRYPDSYWVLDAGWKIVFMPSRAELKNGSSMSQRALCQLQHSSKDRCRFIISQQRAAPPNNYDSNLFLFFHPVS